MPGNYDLRTALIFCYHLKETAAESHRMFVEAYGEHALSKTQCFEWFKKFKSGDFDVRNEERGNHRKRRQRIASIVGWRWRSTSTTTRGSIECDTRSRLHTFEIHRGKDPEDGKMGSWIEWKTVGKSKKPLTKYLLARYKRKSLLYRIVTGNEKWIYFENPKRKRSWVTPGESESTSTARPNHYGRKTMLCVWWDQKGDLLWAAKTWRNVNTERYR